MPRIYNDIKDINPGGWKARKAAKQAADAAAEAKRNDPSNILRAKHRAAFRTADRARLALEAAVAHRDMLNVRLLEAKASVSRMTESAYKTGLVPEGLSRAEAQVAALPALIARAEADILAAQTVHAAEAAQLAALSATAPAEAPSEPAAKKRARAA